MVIARRGPFLLGMLLSLSFFGALSLIVSPIFGGKNGLDFADDLFNKLSKGSSYFIPKLVKKNEQNMGKPFRAAFTVEKRSEQIAQVFEAAGAKVDVQGTSMIVQGDLGKLCQSALEDANYVFDNDGSKVATRYGRDERQVMQDWWAGLTGMEKSFKKNTQVKESEAISEVVRKAIEPAYNFYNVEAQNVSDRWGLMSLMLVFYVLYTLWWGYAILYLFAGLGLSMKKAKVKKEVG
jgi:hypothetical protein